ncbi:MAG: hypothetical protein RLZZ420_1850 [Bacteroidota bacterium]
MKNRIAYTFILALQLLFCSAQTSNIRIATAQDKKAIPNAYAGDIIVSGPTRTNGNKIIISVGEKYEDKIFPGTKILIKGGKYDEIWIECKASGSKNNPIVITNFDGQVETKHMKIAGMSHFKLTGKYDPKGKTGDSRYRGHAVAYAYSQGKYGFFINGQWQNNSKFLLEVTSKKIKGTESQHMSSNFELEYIESGNGGYSNVIKANNEKYISENIKIHDCYIHDTNGEGIYMGNTSSKGDQGVFRNVEIYNNRILRTGLDALQLVQTAGDSKIHNNVLDGGMKWRSSFMDSQDFGASLSFVSGGVEFYNNIIINGGNALFQVFLEKENWYNHPGNSKEISIANNLFLFSRSGLGAYIGPYKANFEELTLVISNNDFVASGFQYNKLHEDKDEAKYMIIGGYAGKGTLNNNRWMKGSTKKDFFSTNFKSGYSTRQNESVKIEQVVFENYSTNGYGFNFFECWTDKLNIGKQKGNPVKYEIGEVVSWKSKIYLCTKPNSQIEPGIHSEWNKYWRLLKFNNGKSYYPADDVRVKKDNYNFKKQRGIN